MILSGEEQYDEQFLLYYDGTVNSETLYEKTETDVAEQQYPIILDMGALENGDGQVIFSISMLPTEELCLCNCISVHFLADLYSCACLHFADRRFLFYCQ